MPGVDNSYLRKAVGLKNQAILARSLGRVATGLEDAAALMGAAGISLAEGHPAQARQLARASRRAEARQVHPVARPLSRSEPGALGGLAFYAEEHLGLLSRPLACRDALAGLGDLGVGETYTPGPARDAYALAYNTCLARRAAGTGPAGGCGQPPEQLSDAQLVTEYRRLFGAALPADKGGVATTTQEATNRQQVADAIAVDRAKQAAQAAQQAAMATAAASAAAVAAEQEAADAWAWDHPAEPTPKPGEPTMVFPWGTFPVRSQVCGTYPKADWLDAYQEKHFEEGTAEAKFCNGKFPPIRESNGWFCPGNPQNKWNSVCKTDHIYWLKPWTVVGRNQRGFPGTLWNSVTDFIALFDPTTPEGALLLMGVMFPPMIFNQLFLRRVYLTCKPKEGIGDTIKCWAGEILNSPEFRLALAVPSGNLTAIIPAAAEIASRSIIDGLGALGVPPNLLQPVKAVLTTLTKSTDVLTLLVRQGPEAFKVDSTYQLLGGMIASITDGTGQVGRVGKAIGDHAKELALFVRDGPAAAVASLEARYIAPVRARLMSEAEKLQSVAQMLEAADVMGSIGGVVKKLGESISAPGLNLGDPIKGAGAKLQQLAAFLKSSAGALQAAKVTPAPDPVVAMANVPTGAQVTPAQQTAAVARIRTLETEQVAARKTVADLMVRITYLQTQNELLLANPGMTPARAAQLASGGGAGGADSLPAWALPAAALAALAGGAFMLSKRR